MRSSTAISCRNRGAPLPENSFWRTQTLRSRRRSSPWLWFRLDCSPQITSSLRGLLAAVLDFPAIFLFFFWVTGHGPSLDYWATFTVSPCKPYSFSVTCQTACLKLLFKKHLRRFCIKWFYYKHVNFLIKTSSFYWKVFVCLINFLNFGVTCS